MILNEEPGWRWPWAARLNVDLPFSAVAEEAIATMSPLRGSIETIAEDGPMPPSLFAIAARASCCFLRSIVV